MKALLYTLIVFMIVFFVSAILRAIVNESAGHGVASLVISFATLVAIFYFPIKTYRKVKSSEK